MGQFYQWFILRVKLLFFDGSKCSSKVATVFDNNDKGMDLIPKNLENHEKPVIIIFIHFYSKITKSVD